MQFTVEKQNTILHVKYHLSISMESKTHYSFLPEICIIFDIFFISFIRFFKGNEYKVAKVLALCPSNGTGPSYRCIMSQSVGTVLWTTPESLVFFDRIPFD